MIIKMTGRCVNIVEENMKGESVQRMEKSVMNVEKNHYVKKLYLRRLNKYHIFSK